MNVLGYQTSIDRHLNGVLNYMVQNGIIDGNTAGRMQGARDQWSNQFIATLPTNAIPEQDFQQALMGYLVNLKNMFSSGFIPPPAPGYYGMPPGGMQPMHSGMPPSYYPPPGYPVNMQPPNNGMRMMPGMNRPSFTGFTPPPNENMFPQNNNIFGGNKPVNSGVVSEVKEEDTDDTPVEYIPSWKNDKTRISVDTKEIDKVSITMFTFPADDTEQSFVRYNISYPMALSSDSAIKDFASILSVGKDRYIAEIAHKASMVVSMDKNELVKCLEEIKLISNALGACSTKFIKLHKYLNTLSRSGYNIFERIIVNKFNSYLKTRAIQCRDNISFNIKILAIEDIMAFIPGSGSVKLDKITSIPNYVNMFEHVLSDIFAYIISIEISNNKEDIIQALKVAGGLDSFNTIIGYMTDNKNTIGEFESNNSVITCDETTIVTNMDVTKSYHLNDALLNKHSIHMISTCALDHVLKNMVTSSHRKIITINNNIIYCGFSGDSTFVCVV